MLFGRAGRSEAVPFDQVGQARHVLANLGADERRVEIEAQVLESKTALGDQPFPEGVELAGRRRAHVRRLGWRQDLIRSDRPVTDGLLQRRCFPVGHGFQQP